MKKDIYVLMGVGALILSAFLGAFLLYNRSQRASDSLAEDFPRADNARLLSSDSPTLGPSMARVTVVEFLDPECESCAAMYPIVKRLLKEYEGRIRLVVRYMPFHGNSTYAASALEAAREQGKYWEALSVLFEKQSEWASHHDPKPELIPKLLQSVGLDMASFKRDAKKAEYVSKIERDKQDGMAVGVTGTPTFFVNGRMLLELGYEPLKSLIDEELK
jgi:protein-disulfide isomerase